MKNKTKTLSLSAIISSFFYLGFFTPVKKLSYYLIQSDMKDMHPIIYIVSGIFLCIGIAYTIKNLLQNTINMKKIINIAIMCLCSFILGTIVLLSIYFTPFFTYIQESFMHVVLYPSFNRPAYYVACGICILLITVGMYALRKKV
ncbi:MAG: hypothetical protein ACI9AR_000228 [Flavobacteriaceae bacterium]|jgi:hypothetical protein